MESCRAFGGVASAIRLAPALHAIPLSPVLVDPHQVVRVSVLARWGRFAGWKRVLLAALPPVLPSAPVGALAAHSRPVLTDDGVLHRVPPPADVQLRQLRVGWAGRLPLRLPLGLAAGPAAPRLASVGSAFDDRVGLVVEVTGRARRLGRVVMAGVPLLHGVFSAAHRFEVFWVHACGCLAEVVDDVAFRDRAVSCLVDHPVGVFLSHPAVPFGVDGAFPYPAFRFGGHSAQSTIDDTKGGAP